MRTLNIVLRFPLWLCVLLYAPQLLGQRYVLTKEISLADGLQDYTIYEMFQDSNGMLWLNNAGSLLVYDGKQFEVVISKPHNYDEAEMPALIKWNKGLYFIDQYYAYLINPETYRIEGTNWWVWHEYRQAKRDFVSAMTFLDKLSREPNFRQSVRIKVYQELAGQLRRAASMNIYDKSIDWKSWALNYGDSTLLIIYKYYFWLYKNELIRYDHELGSSKDKESSGSESAFVHSEADAYLTEGFNLLKLSVRNGQLQREQIQPFPHWITSVVSLNNHSTFYVATQFRGLFRFDRSFARLYNVPEIIKQNKTIVAPQALKSQKETSIGLASGLSCNSALFMQNEVHANNGLYWDKEGMFKGRSKFKFFSLYSDDYMVSPDGKKLFFPAPTNNGQDYLNWFNIEKAQRQRGRKGHQVKIYTMHGYDTKNGQQIPFTDPSFNLARSSCFTQADTLFIHGIGTIGYMHKDKLTLVLQYPITEKEFYHRYCHSLYLWQDTFLLATLKGVQYIPRFEGRRYTMRGTGEIDFRRIQLHKPGVLLFFSYGRGVFRYDAKGLHPVVDSSNTLALKFIHYTFTDKQQRVWMATNFGLLVSDSASWHKWIEGVQPYLSYQKVLPYEFNSGTDHPYTCDTVRGQYFLTSLTGIVSVYPDYYHIKPEKTPIMLWALRDEQDRKQELNRLSQDLKVLKFTFKIACLSEPQTVPIEVYDVANQSWKLCSNNEYSYYRQSPGWHELKFRYQNGYGQQGSQEKLIRFYIPPYWYEQWFYRALMGLGFVGIILLAVYITRRRQLHKENLLKELVNARTRELNNTVHKLVQSEHQMKQNMQMKEKLINVLAHDIRSPLVSTNIVCESLRTDVDKLDASPFKEQASYKLGLITESIDSISSFSNDFLTWYKLHNKSGRTEFSSVNLYRLLIKVIEFYNPVIHAHRNNITYDIDTALYVYTDSSLLTIVLRNLIDNANKYSKGNTIHINTVEADGYISIRIRNASSRHSEDLLDEINEKIQSGMRGDEHYEPKFGLNLVGFIVQRLEGEVKVSYAELNYLVVEVKLKAAEVSAHLQL